MASVKMIIVFQLLLTFHRYVVVLTAADVDSRIAGQYVDQLKEGHLLSNESMQEFEAGVQDLAMNVSSFVRVASTQYALVLEVDGNISRLNDLPGVLRVEPNLRVSASQQFFCTEQSTPDIWGLDRIDQREKSGYVKTYQHGYHTDGKDVYAYVMDTGVDISHTEFGGRAIWGFTASDIYLDRDLNGHGTHVAGIIGAETYGVAKQVKIIAVKVLDDDGTGSLFSIIEGLEWVVFDHQRRTDAKSVINMSLGASGISLTLDDAVQSAIDAGITVVAAAGNDDVDACDVSPAHVADVITVGATNIYDEAAYYSNWGSCLDVWAPGNNIMSTLPFGEGIRSGTSMASPHVAGAVASFMSYLDQPASPRLIQDWLRSVSTAGAITYVSPFQWTSPNLLVYLDCADPSGSFEGGSSSLTTSVPALLTILALQALAAN